MPDVQSPSVQLERSASRLLYMARKSKPNNYLTSPVSKSSFERYRHTAYVKQPIPRPHTLLQSKLRTIAAIYGLDMSFSRFCDPHYLSDSGSISTITDNSDMDEAMKLRDEYFQNQRCRYRNKFKHGMDAIYHPSGKPKLDSLIEAAQEKASKPNNLEIAAAVLTSDDRIYASTALEASIPNSSSQQLICAERVAILKALQSLDYPDSHLIAVAISYRKENQEGDIKQEEFPFPCGDCRQLMAMCGNLAIYITNRLGDRAETTSYALFPQVESSLCNQESCISTNPQSPKGEQKTTSDGKSDTSDARGWNSRQVVAWIGQNQKLQSYAHVFERNSVNGATLLQLESADIDMLFQGQIEVPVKKYLLQCIDRLRDEDLLKNLGANLKEYLALLDRDRVGVLARLKALFTHLDTNNDGVVDRVEIRSILEKLPPSSRNLYTDPNGLRVDLSVLESYLDEVASIDFPTFVNIIAAHTNPDDRHPSRLPLKYLNIKKLEVEFERRAKANKSSTISIAEAVELLSRLGLYNRKLGTHCCPNKRQNVKTLWSEYGECISLEVFVLGVAQLCNIHLAKAKMLFLEASPRYVEKWKPWRVLFSSLRSLYQYENPVDISKWCRHQQEVHTSFLEESQQGSLGEKYCISYPFYIYLCLKYNYDFAHAKDGNGSSEKKGLSQESERSRKLCHNSRIVKLPFTNHVRMCRRFDRDDDEFQDKKVVTSEDEVCCSGMNHHKKRAMSKEEVNDVYDRFLRTQMQRKADTSSGKWKKIHKMECKGESESEDDGKHADSDVESKGCEPDMKQEGLTIAMATQALIELGVPYSAEVVASTMDQSFAKKLQSIDDKNGCVCIMRSGFHQLYAELASKPRKRRETSKAGATSSKEKVSYRRQRRVVRKKKKADSCAGKSTTKRDRRKPKHSSESKTSSSSDSYSSDEVKSADQQKRYRSYYKSHQISVGDRVNILGRGYGVVIRIYKDYVVADVRLDTGKLVSNVSLSSMELERHSQSQVKTNTIQLPIGTIVQVHRQGMQLGKRKAKVIRHRINGCYDLRTIDTTSPEVLSNISPSQITFLSDSLQGGSLDYLPRGQAVMVKRTNEYLRGCIHACRGNGTYDVLLRKDRSTVLESLPPALLLLDEPNASDDDLMADKKGMKKKKQASERKDDSDSDSDAKPTSHSTKFKLGDSVEARFNGEKSYYSGRITRVDALSRRYDIDYDDGDQERNVEEHLIRLRDRSAPGKDDYEDDGFESD